MNPSTENIIQIEIENLRSQIEHHSDLYYQKDAPEISDFEFDQLLDRLKKLEEEFPASDYAGQPDAAGRRQSGQSEALYPHRAADVAG